MCISTKLETQSDAAHSNYGKCGEECSTRHPASQAIGAKVPADTIRPESIQATVPACQERVTAAASFMPLFRATSFTGSISRKMQANSLFVLNP